MLPLSNDNSRVQSWKPIDAAADCIGANTMSEIKWDDQVQVQMLEPTGIENYQVVEENVIKWDGIDFAEAVKRCMMLSPQERAKASILAPSGYYDRKEVEALFHRLP
jgi:hypothetical protein